MSRRIKDSERQKMLVEYTKTGIVADGFYVKEMKDGRIQFRRIKQTPGIEELTRKIEMYNIKIERLRQLILSMNKEEEEE